MTREIEKCLLCGLRYSTRRAVECAETCETFLTMLDNFSDKAVAEIMIEMERWKQNEEMITRAGGRSLQSEKDKTAAEKLLDAARAENTRREMRM